MTDLPDTYALNAQGHEYKRPCRTVGELPHELRSPALKMLARALGLSLIRFGVPVHVTLGMTKRQARKHTCDWLLNSGDTMPLSLLPKDDKQILAKLVGYDIKDLTFGSKLRETATGREICPFALAPVETEQHGNETVVRTYQPLTDIIVSTATGQH